MPDIDAVGGTQRVAQILASAESIDDASERCKRSINMLAVTSAVTSLFGKCTGGRWYLLTVVLPKSQSGVAFRYKGILMERLNQMFTLCNEFGLR